MRAFYNEIDSYCCDWLSNLMDAGCITVGKIDDRSIVDVFPDDVRGYERCHFFAGIGGWDYALSLCGYAGPVWTGSCPCQPFSAAGKGKGADDERHLWPAWFSLIRECRPARVFGEQVEAAIGWGWLDVVFADLEAEGYACGAAVLPACGVGAPHIRQRVWFVADNIKSGLRWADRPQGARLRNAVERHGAVGELADAAIARCGAGRAGEAGNGRDAARLEPPGLCPDGMGHANGQGSQAREWPTISRERGPAAVARSHNAGELADATDSGRQPFSRRRRIPTTQIGNQSISQFGFNSEVGEWADIDWLPCTDGKARPTQSGLQPLAHGIPGRVGRLRAYGNAIVPQVAAEFIKAATEANND